MKLIAYWALLRAYLSSRKWTAVSCFLLILAFHISAPVLANSSADRAEEDAFDEILDTRTEEEKYQSSIKRVTEALKERGKWLNSPLPTEADADALLVEQDMRKILNEFIEKNPKLGEIPIRIFVYENSAPNAWVSRFGPNSKDLQYMKSKDIIKALGYDPNVGFIELGITSALFRKLPKTRDAVSFVIGHEGGHITEKHLKDGSDINWEDVHKGWLDRHIHEFAADGSGLESMKGLFNLDDAILALKSLFETDDGVPRPKLPPNEIEKLVINALDNALSTHPHEGIRIAVAEALARHKKRQLNVEIPSTPLPECYIRVSTKHIKQRTFHLSPSTIAEIKKIFEGNPKEITGGFDSWLYFSLIVLRPQIVDLFIKTLEENSSSDFLKALALMRTLGNSFASKDNGEEPKKKIKLSDYAWQMLDHWLSHITNEQRDQIAEALTKKENAHSLLMGISNLPRGTVRPGVWTGIEKLTLSYFQKTMDSYILLGGDSFNKENQLGDEFKKSENLRLQQAILLMAQKNMKTVTLENVEARATQAFRSRKFSKSFDPDALSKTTIIRSLIDFSNWSLTTTGAPGIKLQITQTLRAIQSNVIGFWFTGYTFPDPHTIVIAMKTNPNYENAWKYGSEAPYALPDYTQPPFDQLDRLNFLDHYQFERVKTQVSSFFGSFIFGNPKYWGSQDQIREGIRIYYNERYDSIIADQIIKRISEVETEKIPNLIEAWHSIRKQFDNEPLKITAKQWQELSAIVQRVPDDVLLKSDVVLASAGTFDKLGRMSLLWETSSIQAMQSFLLKLKKSIVRNEFVETFLMSLIKKVPDSKASAILWIDTIETALTLEFSHYATSVAIESKLRQASLNVMKYFSSEELLKFAKTEKLRTIFYEDELAKIFQNEVERRFRAAGSDLAQLPKLLNDFEKEFKLERSDTTTSKYRNLLARTLKIQPQHRKLIDPTEGQSITEMGSGNFSKMVRGFSGLLEMVRELPTQEQISFIRFINGQSSHMPAFVKRFNDSVEIKKVVSHSSRNIEGWVQEARQRMTESDELTRSLIIHSFLTGPTGLMNSPNDLAHLERTLLDELPFESRKSTELVMKALKASEGREYGLLLSYALAQKSKTSNAPGGAGLLKAFLESYGVPGTKFGQFMAFSSRFKSFRPAFESFQDSALPISYIGMLKLLEKSLGVPWDPSRFEVIETKGSGSVNIAITVRDIKLGTEKILNVLREDVEIEAKNDFKRFQRFVTELGKHSFNTDLAFIGGVARLVEDSVAFEFDKPRAKRMHDISEVQYAHKVGEWTVRSVHVDEVLGRSLVMDVAPGESARQILNTDFETYKSAMGAFLSVAKQRIRGLGVDGKPSKVPIISDPDIHNGQFFIDKKTKTITLLDKGQSSTPSGPERDLARTLFRVATLMIKGNQIHSSLKEFESHMGVKLESRHIARIQQTQKAETPIDRYLSLVGYLREIGRVPTATVDWGFEFYRLYELSSQIDKLREWEIKSVLLEGHFGKSVRSVIDAYGTFSKKSRLSLPIQESTCKRFYGVGN